MKITLIGPVYPYRGGIAHYNTSLAKALKDSGHSVSVISFKRQYPAWLYPGESDKDPSVEPVRFTAQYLLDPLYPWTWFHTARFIKGEKPQLVLFHWWTTFWAPAYTTLAWLIRRQVKVTFLIHNVLPHEPKPWDRWLARTTLRQGKIFIIQAPHENERLKSLIPVGSQVINSALPVYAPFSEIRLSKVEARQLLGLPDDKPILLFFGIVRPYKGLNHLIDALALVKHPIHLVVAGEFWEQINFYQQQIESLGLSQQVTLLNRYIPNEEAHRLFSAADGLVAPYVGGTQSGAAGLALGYGIPMIVTDRVAAGLPEKLTRFTRPESLAENCGYAHIVPAGDPNALAQAINSLITRLPTIVISPFAASDDWARLVHIIDELCIGQ